MIIFTLLRICPWLYGKDLLLLFIEAFGLVFQRQIELDFFTFWNWVFLFCWFFPFDLFFWQNRLCPCIFLIFGRTTVLTRSRLCFRYCHRNHIQVFIHTLKFDIIFYFCWWVWVVSSSGSPFTFFLSSFYLFTSFWPLQIRSHS